MPEKPQKSPKGPAKKKPWPEDLVTSPKTQQIGQAISQIHHHLDQLMEQADLIAAYMPPQPVITSRPVVTLNASMIVTQKQEDEEALRALRQDIAQKQTDLAANTQTTNKQTTNTQNTNIDALHNDDVKQAEMPNSGSDAQKPHATQEAKTIALIIFIFLSLTASLWLVFTPEGEALRRAIQPYLVTPYHLIGELKLAFQDLISFIYGLFLHL